MNEVLRESERGQRKRVQVMVLSCWCHRQIQALLAAWLSSASHTISPSFAISPFSISLHLPPWCSDSRCDALFCLPIRQLPAILYIYHSPLFSLSLTEKKQRYLTYTSIVFTDIPSPYPSLVHTVSLSSRARSLCYWYTFLFPYTPGPPYTYNNTPTCKLIYSISMPIDSL